MITGMLKIGAGDDLQITSDGSIIVILYATGTLYDKYRLRSSKCCW